MAIDFKKLQEERNKAKTEPTPPAPANDKEKLLAAANRAKEREAFLRSMESLALIYARAWKMYKDDGVYVRGLVRQFASARDNLSFVYSFLIAAGELAPIEELDPALQEEIASEAAEWIPLKSAVLLEPAQWEELRRRRAKVQRAIVLLAHLIEKYKL